MAAAREFVALVRDGATGTTSEEQRMLLNMALESCDQIRCQFTELLELARIDSGKLTLQQQAIPMEGMVLRCMASVADAARQKNLVLEGPTNTAALPTVFADGERIIQVIANLLANAVKFTDFGGKVTLTISSQSMAKQVRISVNDTGCGVPAEEMDCIFERLYQVEQAGNDLNGSSQGLGLGLSICQEILQLHNTKLFVSSKLAEGSCFWFDLPVLH